MKRKVFGAVVSLLLLLCYESRHSEVENRFSFEVLGCGFCETGNSKFNVLDFFFLYHVSHKSAFSSYVHACTSKCLHLKLCTYKLKLRK